MNQFIAEEEQKEYFTFLNALRASGVTNMYGAVPYLRETYPKLRENDALAHQVLREWIACFGKES